MAMIQRVQTQRPTPRPLSQEEIDGRIERIWIEVLSARGLVPDGAGDDGRPVWISTSELVRRMLPFLSHN